MECAICLEEIKGKRNSLVTCQHCPATACRQCHQRHLLLSFEDPNCFSCKREWNADFMAGNFPISFRNGALRAHRRRVLVEREKAVLPALQIYAEYRRKIRELHGKRAEVVKEFGNEHVSGDTIAFRYRTLKNKLFVVGHKVGQQNREIHRLKEMENTIELVTRDIQLKSARKLRGELREMEGKIQEEVAAIEPRYLELKEQHDTVTMELRETMNLYGGRAAAAQKREFIMRCPADGCRGFLSTSYKCGTCEAWACTQCHVSVGKEKECGHVCDAGMVETAKAIKEETRPCPKCGTRIFKIDGCDQMYCVMDGCHTAFSWNTGQIATGVIHNPHYLEWLKRKNGGLEREAGDIPCGGLPTTWQMVGAIRDLQIENALTTVILETFRNFQELIEYRLPDYPFRLPQLANKEDDVDYLLNEISEDVWQARLEKTETKFVKKKEIGQILQTLATAGSDMLNGIYQQALLAETGGPKKEEAFVAWLLETALPELEQLRTFANESFLALAKRDRMAVPQFETNWVWKGLRAVYSKKPEARAATEIVETEMVEA